ncbi:MAG: FAD-dependent oxidoreductase [Chloroflexota bacterium]
METHAKLVIIGAGIVGCSAAYELTKLGWTDIVVIDQGPLYETGGSTSHAPGITFGTNPSRMMQKMAKYTTDLYNDLTFKGEQVWYPVGTVEVATSDARMKELWRKQGQSLAYDVECHIISPTEVQDLVPLVDPDVLKGGLFRPSDGNVKAWKAAGALALKAIDTGGVKFYGHTLATDIDLKDGRVQAVITDKGRIECEKVLLCTNIWGSVLADKLGITLPMMACAHHYAITEPLPELADETEWISQPPLRHQDCSMYFRQWDQGWCNGSYRHEPRLVSPHDVGKDAYHHWRDDDFAIAIDDANHLFPTLQGREYVTKVNGMFVFSIDGYPIMGPTQVPGCWTAIGIWVTHAGGAGKSIAEWMVHGHTEWAMHEADVNRFQKHEVIPSYIKTRTAQGYREVYDIIHPLQQMENPRNLRTAPYHQRLIEQKSHFHVSAGWEVAQWYEENARLLEEYDAQIPHRSGWEAEHWSRIQGAEHLDLRDKVGVYNSANFAKFDVKGKGALDFLEGMTVNRIDRPIGSIVYTALCDAGGGIKADLTITRLAHDHFMILTGAGTGPADLTWLSLHAPKDGSVVIEDASSRLSGLALWGPKARQVLEQVTDEDVSNEAFPYFTAQDLHIGNIPVLAARLSYAGELGWELYCSTEYGLNLWDTIWEAGRPHEVFALGAGAFNSLRLEKGYRAVGSDLTTDHNPYEAGLGWAVRINKGDFLGREALLKSKEAGISKKLCCLTSSDPNAMALGKEPIFAGGHKIGYVTSADYGYSAGKLIAYGYLPIEYATNGTSVEIQYFERRFEALVSDDPQFDKKMIRLKS